WRYLAWDNHAAHLRKNRRTVLSAQRYKCLCDMNLRHCDSPMRGRVRDWLSDITYAAVSAYDHCGAANDPCQNLCCDARQDLSSPAKSGMERGGMCESIRVKMCPCRSSQLPSVWHC